MGKTKTTVDSLSFEGSVFFSDVSVFFSLVLSKEATADTSGLSDMIEIGSRLLEERSNQAAGKERKIQLIRLDS